MEEDATKRKMEVDVEQPNVKNDAVDFKDIFVTPTPKVTPHLTM